MITRILLILIFCFLLVFNYWIDCLVELLSILLKPFPGLLLWLLIIYIVLSILLAQNSPGILTFFLKYFWLINFLVECTLNRFYFLLKWFLCSIIWTVHIYDRAGLWIIDDSADKIILATLSCNLTEKCLPNFITLHWLIFIDWYSLLSISE